MPKTRNADLRRRELARQVRNLSLTELLESFRREGVERAFLVFENGQFTLSHPKLLEPIQAFFELSQDFARHEAVFIGTEPEIPTLFFAFVHDTRRGLAQGGLRYRLYDSVASILEDGLRLSQGMTRKNALAGLWWGGGKGILPMTPAMQTEAYLKEGAPRRLEVFKAYARFVASLNGVYYTAEDIGTKTTDMDAMLSQNRFQTCISSSVGGSGNPSPATARGVFWAMQAAWRFLTGSDRLQGVKVAVQGAGNVGGVLIRLLDDAGAEVWTSDVNREVLAELAEERPRVKVVAPQEILSLPVDIVAPCAIGDQINVRTIPTLKARLVCGAANNILGEPADAERLKERGIAFVPDYVCNRMGITNCADEWQGYLAQDVQVAAQRLYPDTLRILRHARNLYTTTTAAADELADIAACELHPQLGHRGRRIVDHLIASGWHRPSRPVAERPAEALFVPALDEAGLRLRWKQPRRFEGARAAVAAGPLSTASRPSLDGFLSALLADVRARSLEASEGGPCRRLLGSDPAGLTLQLAVERSLPYEREETGRTDFLEACKDLHRSNDAAVREQLHEAGVDFDPQGWLDPMSSVGTEAVRRLYFALKDAGLIRSEQRLGHHCLRCHTVLVASEVKPTRLKIDRRYRIRFQQVGGGDPIDTLTFFPELLVGVVAVTVKAGGSYASAAGGEALHPLTGAPLPILAADALEADASFLVPGYRGQDEKLARLHGLSVFPPVYDDRGRVLLAAEAGTVPRAVERREARQAILEKLGEAAEAMDGGWSLDARRCQRCESMVLPLVSEQVFLHLEQLSSALESAVRSGAVRFSDEIWKEKVLAYTRRLEPLCISRQQWWGHELPDRPEEVLSAWFSLMAWSLAATGWPRAQSPAPVDEVFVNPDLLLRWVVPSQLIALQLFGCPAFRRIAVHGALHIVDRDLVEVPGIAPDAPDEERFLVRSTLRPMRKQLGNVVEPATLVHRFGADALRLGALLCLGSGRPEVVTFSEGALRQARRTLHRLAAQVGGLHRLGPDRPGDAPSAADLKLRSHLETAAEAATLAYRELRLGDAASALVEAVEQLRSYGRSAAAGEAADVPATLAIALGHLVRGFSPICPYLFSKLELWAREHGLEEPAPAPPASASSQVPAGAARTSALEA
ncbi:MAG: class I tRNA ligase family protein [Acidobacteria bacterium]|nr:class I tRNA ligase family protein [Acidobacteriota bacterium]